MAQMVRMQGEFVSSIRRRAPRGCAPGRRPTACDVSLPRNSPAASATRPPAFRGGGRSAPDATSRRRIVACATRGARRDGAPRVRRCRASAFAGGARPRDVVTSRRSIGARRHVECGAGRRVTARDAFPPHGIPRRRARRALPRSRGPWMQRLGPRRSRPAARSSPPGVRAGRRHTACGAFPL